MTKTDRVDSIISAAVRCFAKNGIAAVSLDDIANEAGISRRTLYNHFESREQILDATYARNAIDFIGKLSHDLNSDQPFTDFATDAVMYIIEKSPEQPLFDINMRGDMAWEARSRYLKSTETDEAWINAFRPAYIQALRSGSINPELELEDIIQWIGRLGLSFIQHPYIGERPMAATRKQVELFFTNALRFGIER